MNYQDVKYTQLSNKTEVCSRCCTPRKLFTCFFILIVTLIGLLVTCYSHSSICNKHDYQKVHIRLTKRRLPHCIIIGARKAGTRALLTYLKVHPDIQTAQYEVHFFDNQENYDFGYGWYRKQMPYSFPDQLTIEKSPAYFTESSVPGRVYSMNSTIKILLIVRDPVQRTISDQLQLNFKGLDMGLEVKPFEELVLNPKTGNIDMNFKPVQRSYYDVYMKNWLKYFPLNQIHIVDGDQLIADPYPEVYKVESFLGLRHAIPQSDFVYNATKGFYCIKTDTAYQKCLSGSKGRSHPHIQKEVIEKLKNVFWKHNENFFELVNQRFFWNNKTMSSKIGK